MPVSDNNTADAVVSRRRAGGDGDPARLRHKLWVVRHIFERPGASAHAGSERYSPRSPAILECRHGIPWGSRNPLDLGRSRVGLWSNRYFGNQLRAATLPSESAIRTSMARESASILCITWARCTLTVFSVVPSTPAICLLSIPVTTSAMTSLSRGVSVSNRDDRRPSL